MQEMVRLLSWLYCAIFLMPSFRKSLRFFGTSITSLDPETFQVRAFYMLSAMFTGACGPPEKLSLTLVQHSNVLYMTVKLTYCEFLGGGCGDGCGVGWGTDDTQAPKQVLWRDWRKLFVFCDLEKLQQRQQQGAFSSVTRLKKSQACPIHLLLGSEIQRRSVV